MSSRRLKTSFSKGVVIFSIICLLAAIGVILLFSFTEQQVAIKVTMIAFASLFGIIALILLIGQLTIFVYIDGEYLHSQFIFTHKKIKLSKIKTLIYQKEVYYVYDKLDKKFCSINSFDPRATEIIMCLENNGAKMIEEQKN